MQEEYHVDTLKEIRTKCQTRSNQHFTTVGTIVDCANPNRRDPKKDLCLRIKIIDASHSKEPCHVFVYAKKAEEFPKRIRIGDILFLHRFQFEIWEEALQAKKPFKVDSAFIRFFSGEPDLTTYSPIDEVVEIDDADGRILNAVNEVRKFNRAFFKANAVPSYPRNGNNKSSDFDLFLRVTNCEKTLSCFKVSLTDEHTEYFIESNRPVEPGVYKVRSIAEVTWKGKVGHLIGNDYTCFLQIFKWMKSFDSSEWTRLTPGKEATRKKESDKLRTVISQASNRQRMNLQDLLRSDTHTTDTIVRCEVLQVFTTIEKALKKYDALNHTERNYDAEGDNYIYHIHLALTDASMNGEVFNAYIYTYDGKGAEFLPELDSSRIFGKNILPFKERYEHIMNRLLEETDFEESPIELVLSPMFNGRQTIYRIVDTELVL